MSAHRSHTRALKRSCLCVSWSMLKWRKHSGLPLFSAWRASIRNPHFVITKCTEGAVLQGDLAKYSQPLERHLHCLTWVCNVGVH